MNDTAYLRWIADHVKEITVDRKTDPVRIFMWIV